MAGRDVVVLPDNDNAGRKYADPVAHILAKLHPARKVRVVELPELPDGGDVFEFIAARRLAGLDNKAIRESIEALADAAAPIELERPAMSVEPFRPFPLGALPETLARFVGESAAALGCDPVFVALPCLPVVAASIGTSRVIEPQRCIIRHAYAAGRRVCRVWRRLRN